MSTNDRRAWRGILGYIARDFFTGYLTDTRGPGPALLLGAVSLFWGYYPLYLGTNPNTFREDLS